MSVSLECMKAKRTGFLPAFLGGALLAAAVPVLNMAVRSEIYLPQQGSAVQILLDADWQMMAMLNLLLITAGACILYHTEYADNAMQKMMTLPVCESSVFLGKVILTVFMSILTLAAEAGAVAFCCFYWFHAEKSSYSELCRSFGYEFVLMLPCIFLSLLISQACRNMWVSLGIGVLCIFTASMLPANHFVLSLFPFAAPFQTLPGTDSAQVLRYLCAMAAELAVLSLAELILIKIRGSFA